MAVPISVLILTFNEEVNLARCLASLKWCDDIVVLDSGSTDTTQAIALRCGARCIERPFDNYATQRNFGLKEIDYKYSWVLMVDADEEVTTKLVAEMAQTIDTCCENDTLFRMRRKDHLLGKWIKRSSGYPTWFGRLVRPDRVQVVREINEEFVTEGDVGLLRNHLNHYPFNKGFAAWLEKHNRYSSMEANLMIKGGLRAISFDDLISWDPATRRRGIKSIVYRLPFRPVWMFFALYVVRGGFLDGRAGFVFCVLRAIYEFMISCKVLELKLRVKGDPI
jgi:glycosyltransferase involved in cell wall biosynthesis